MKHEFMLNSPAEARVYFADKLSFTTGPIDLSQELQNGNSKIKIVDVRAANDYSEGHIPGAISLPEYMWADSSVLSKEDINIFYCYSQVCHLAARAAFQFSSQGFPVMELEGGMKSWREHNLELERSDYESDLQDSA